MTFNPAGIALSLTNIDIKTMVGFTYRRTMIEQVDCSPINYTNGITYNGIISALAEGLVAADRKIDAIKQIRADNDGLALKDAKEIAEAMIALYTLQHPPLEKKVKDDIRDQFDLKIQKEMNGDGQWATFKFPNDNLLKRDCFIEYVKALRSENRISLLLAKKIADEMWIRMGLRDD